MSETGSGPSAGAGAAPASSEGEGASPAAASGGEQPASGMSYAHTSGMESTGAMNQAAQETYAQFTNAAEAQPEAEVTADSLRAEIHRLEKQQSTPQPKMRYTIGGPGEQAMHESVFTDNTEAIKQARERLAGMEKEQRRKDYMAMQDHEIDPEEEEGPEED